MGWSSSDRRSRLPANWPALRAECERRAQGKCQAQGRHAPGCDGLGGEADHINQGDDHSIENLQWLSPACHARKTRLDNGSAAKLALPLEVHPAWDRT